MQLSWAYFDTLINPGVGKLDHLDRHRVSTVRSTEYE